jgi:SagB-type dehydrogenase family enzyme
MLTSRFVLILLPLALYFLWFGVHLATRSIPNRFTTTTAFSLVVLVYFLAVVGTGIFWVATQDLPIFAWHYLPGYILLTVTLVHVALHWRKLVSLLKRDAPKALIEPDCKHFKLGIRIVGYCLLATTAGTVVFYIGVRQGSHHITIVSREFSRGLLTKPLIPLTFVDAGGAHTTLAEYYHKISSYPRVAFHGLTVSARHEPFKDYPGKPAVTLPPVKSEGGGSILDAYRSWVAGQAHSDAGELTLERLSQLLYHTLGVSKKAQYGGLAYDLRTAPSAGALYPVNLYILANKIQGLAPGLYYYNSKKSALFQVRSDPMLPIQLQMLSGSPELLTDAPVTVIFTATFGRTAFKYYERTYRFVAMEVGHAAYNLGLSAASFGLRAPMIGRFDDHALNTLLDINPSTEAGFLIMPLGSSRATSPEPVFQRENIESSKASFTDLIHNGTSIRLVGMGSELPRHPSRLQAGPRDITLPVAARGKPLLESINLRRSVRDYSSTSMSMEELSALCAASAENTKDLIFNNPLLVISAPLTLYIVVRDVKGVKPGVYRYLPAYNALQILKEGDFSKQCEDASLKQEFVGTANVVFIISAKWQDILYPDGDRGYRYANMRAGLMGEGIYLQGASLGVGICAVGAFNDSSIASMIGLNIGEEIPIYEIAAGK